MECWSDEGPGVGFGDSGVGKVVEVAGAVEVEGGGDVGSGCGGGTEGDGGGEVGSDGKPGGGLGKIDM